MALPARLLVAIQAASLQFRGVAHIPVSQIEAYHKPWTAATGNTVVSEDYSGGIAEVKAQVEAGNVTWDIIDVEKSDAVRGCDEGLFMEIDPTSLPAGSDGTAAVDDFIPGSFTDCAVANIVWSTIFAMIHLYANGRQLLQTFFNVRCFPWQAGSAQVAKGKLGNGFGC